MNTSEGWMMKRLWVVLAVVITACTAMAQADVVGIGGPARASWGTTINVIVTVANPGKVATARQKFEIAMRRWAARPTPWQILAPIEIRPIWQGAKVDVAFPIILPAAPDPLGNLDGEFDIGLLDPAGPKPSEPICPVHSLQIETRDQQGMIGGVYIPRNSDLLGILIPDQWSTLEPGAFFTALFETLSGKPNSRDSFRELIRHALSVTFSDKIPKGDSRQAMWTLMRLTRGDLAPVGSKRTIRMWVGDKVIDSTTSACKPILAGGRMVFFFTKPVDAPEGTARFEIPLRTGEYVKALTRTTLVKDVERAVRFETANRTLKFELAWATVENQQFGGMDNPKAPWAYITIECTRPMQTWGWNSEWKQLLEQ